MDTNILIDAFSDDYSYQARLMKAVLDERITALTTMAIEREYRKILRRLIDDNNYKAKVEHFLATAQLVKPQETNVQIDDEDDRKFIAAALGGGAEMIVSKDRHLLDVGEVEGVRIVTPAEAWHLFAENEEEGKEWQDWAQKLGIG